MGKRLTERERRERKKEGKRRRRKRRERPLWGPQVSENTLIP